jgi:hypothetical protein
VSFVRAKNPVLVVIADCLLSTTRDLDNNSRVCYVFSAQKGFSITLQCELDLAPIIMPQ